MYCRELGEIISLLKENGLNEIEIKEPGRNIRIRCSYQSGKSAPAQQPGKVNQQLDAGKKESNIYLAKSQHVGYFRLFRKKSEDETEVEPFVRIGQKVGLEDVLGVIECLEFYYKIKLADYKDFKGEHGIIEKILVKDAEGVEYGRPLFSIKQEKSAD